MPSSVVLRVGLIVLYGALAAVSASIVRDDPELSLAGASGSVLAVELMVGALLMLAALVAPNARRLPWLLAAAALAWPVAEWNSPAAGDAFTAGLALAVAWPVPLAAAALRGPDDRPLGRPAGVVIAAGALATIGVLGLLSAAVFDPRVQGCAACPANHLLIAGDTGAWHHLGQAGLVASVAWTVALAVTAAGVLARSAPARRRLGAPVLAPAVVAVALFGADALHSVSRGYLSSDPTDRALRLAQSAMLACVAAGVVWGRWRAWRTRGVLARLVIDLGTSPSPGGLRERLAATLGDPALQLRFARGGSWIDADGRPAAMTDEPGREATRVTVAGAEVCAVIHRQGLLHDPALAHEFAASVRLALEHERLHALRRAQLDDLRASRARIVAAADGERRRLERDLHDGAQQRLVALAVAIRLARRRLGGDRRALDRELGESEEQLALAIDELRRVAHGLFPAALGEDGLAAALEALAEDDLRLVPGSLTDARCSEPVESAAYFLVAQALRLAGTGEVGVETRHEGGHLLIDVNTTAALTETVPARVDDRIGAVGGTLTTTPNRLRAELPCAS